MFGFNAEEVFQMAIELEEHGKAFYDKAQELVDDETVKELFRYLGAEEIKHKKKSEELKASLPDQAKGGSVHDPHGEMDQYLKMMADMHVFRTSQGVDDRLGAVKTAEDALKLAIEFEKDSVIFFLSMQDATDDNKGKELIGQLVKEEQEHLRKLTVKLRDLKKK